MKITIKGDNPITSDNVKSVLDDLADEVGARGVTIKNMTLYIRFLNEEGQTVDLVDEYGDSVARTITVRNVQKIKEPENKSKVIDFNKKKSKKTSKDKDK